MVVIALLLSGCSVTIFRGNWRYTAEAEAHGRLEAERTQPPQKLSNPPETITR